MSIMVKLTLVPGATQEFGLDDGSTVATLLQLAGKDAGNYSIRVNGSAADTQTALHEGSQVLLAKNAVGNS